eukprot:gene23871-biopygen1298
MVFSVRPAAYISSHACVKRGFCGQVRPDVPRGCGRYSVLLGIRKASFRGSWGWGWLPGRKSVSSGATHAPTASTMGNDNNIICARPCVLSMGPLGSERGPGQLNAGHRVDQTRDDFDAGGPSKLSARVPNMTPGPRPGTPQIPEMLENSTPAGVREGPDASPGFPKRGCSGHSVRASHQIIFPNRRVRKGMLPAEPKTRISLYFPVRIPPCRHRRDLWERARAGPPTKNGIFGSLGSIPLGPRLLETRVLGSSGGKCTQGLGRVLCSVRDQDIGAFLEYFEHFVAFWMQNRGETGFVHALNRQTYGCALKMDPMDGTHSREQKNVVLDPTDRPLRASGWRSGGWRDILEAKCRRTRLGRRVKQIDIRAPAEHGSHGSHPQL